MFRRHRAGDYAPPSQNEDDDDDDDDPFNAMARKKKKRKKTKTMQEKNLESERVKPPAASAINLNSSASSSTTQPPAMNHGTTELSSSANQQDPSSSSQNDPMVVSTTSSMKRHHKGLSNTRKVKMDSMLAELQMETEGAAPGGRNRYGGGSGGGGVSNSNRYGDAAARGSGGSHVEPGQEHLTTNIFVGNLAPTITEEELQRLFGKFGELYSVKIMWPRTPEERARQRLTGFVCFYNRQDAEDAMEACSEVDAFSNGRRLMLRWGKNVLKEQQHRKSRRQVQEESMSQVLVEQPITSNPETVSLADDRPKLHIKIPPEKRRAKFISLVASYVAKDGTDLEQMLLNEGAQGLGLGNQDLRFLTYRPMAEDKNEEHIFYKWRVWAYAHGDGDSRWRTEPFVMFASSGEANGDCCLWVPPPIDLEAARQEELAVQRQKLEQEKLRQERRRHRRPEPQERKLQGQQKQRALSRRELDEFDSLTRRKLCASREAIASAMSFCFEKCSVAAPQICSLLRDLLMQTSRGVSVESRIARLYLLSDILFNSQQPGVKNAFYFRDAIERMAPDVFESLGRDRTKRMQHNKMQKAVSAVLAAWANWSVYIPSFLDELQAKFEGHKIEAQIKREDEQTKDEPLNPDDSVASVSAADKVADQVASTLPLGDWKDVDEADDADEDPLNDQTDSAKKDGEVDGEPVEVENRDSKADDTSTAVVDADGEPADDEADGAPLEQFDNGGVIGGDADGEPLDQNDEDEDADGKPLGQNGEDEDADGKPLDQNNEDEDADGEPLDQNGEDEDADGEPLDQNGEDEDADGEPLDQNDEDVDADGKSM